MKIEDINVRDTSTHDDDACKTLTEDIYFTSSMDSTYLTAKDGYDLSDLIVDSSALLHVGFAQRVVYVICGH